MAMSNTEVVAARLAHLTKMEEYLALYNGEARVPYPHLYWMNRNEFRRYDTMCRERKIGPYRGN